MRPSLACTRHRIPRSFAGMTRSSAMATPCVNGSSSLPGGAPACDATNTNNMHTSDHRIDCLPPLCGLAKRCLLKLNLGVCGRLSTSALQQSLACDGVLSHLFAVVLRYK